MRRFATIILSLCLSLSLTGVHYLLAQDDTEEGRDTETRSRQDRADPGKREGSHAEAGRIGFDRGPDPAGG